MAIEKQKNFMEDELIVNTRKNVDETNWEIYGEEAVEVYKKRQKQEKNTGREKARQWNDPTRACVKCAAPLHIYGETAGGFMMLECERGHTQLLNDTAAWNQEDIDLEIKEHKAVGAEFQYIPDILFKTIPDELVMRYTEMRKDRRARYGK